VHQLRQRWTEVIGFEAEGAGFAFVNNPVVGVDQIQAVGPASVGALGRVAKLVKDRGKFNSQLAHAGAGNLPTLFFISWAGKNHFVLYIALHLPHVAGVCFQDVDHQEGDLAVVVVCELVESGNLPPEGRSSVAAKDKDDRFLGGESGELNAVALVELEQREVRSGIAGAEFAGAGVSPERLEG
jgi:hypothetical protein